MRVHNGPLYSHRPPKFPQGGRFLEEKFSHLDLRHLRHFRALAALAALAAPAAPAALVAFVGCPLFIRVPRTGYPWQIESAVFIPAPLVRSACNLPAKLNFVNITLKLAVLLKIT